MDNMDKYKLIELLVDFFLNDLILDLKFLFYNFQF